MALSGVVQLATPAEANVRSQALYARGLVSFNTGQWERAYRLFDQAVQADGTDAGALYYRGLTQARRGARAAAIRDLTRALKLDPALPHAALDLGILNFDAGQYRGAKAWLERARQQGGDRFTAAFFLGLTLYRLGDDTAAGAYLNEAKADPALRPAAQYYAGLALMRQGKTAAARAELSRAAREQPESQLGRTAARYLAGVEARQPPSALRRERRKRWSLYGELGFEYDDNVVIAPSDSEVKAAEGISRQSDGRSVIALGGDYRLLDTDFGSLRAEYDFSQSIHFRLNEFDLQGHRVRLEAASRPARVSYGVAATYDFYALNYQSFFQEGLATPWVALTEGRNAATQVYYTFRVRDFFRRPFDPARDAADHALGVRQYLTLGSPDRVLSVGYQFDSEDTFASGLGARDFENNGHQVDIGLALPVLSLVRAEFSYTGRLEDYQFLNSRANFQFRRHDNEHQFGLALTRELTRHLSVSLSYFGVINNSNISAFDYDRNIVSALVRMTL
ncbi:MAG: tetratricopeptide repeat protein [Candidatus Binatia bacterium]